MCTVFRSVPKKYIMCDSPCFFNLQGNRMELNKVTLKTIPREWQDSMVEGTWVIDSLGEAPYWTVARCFNQCTHFDLFVIAAISTLCNYLIFIHILKFQLIGALQNAVNFKLQKHTVINCASNSILGGIPLMNLLWFLLTAALFRIVMMKDKEYFISR